jgi:MFS family permease
MSEPSYPAPGSSIDWPSAAGSDAVASSAKRKAYTNVVLPLAVISVIAYIDRVNVGYAALTMNADLGFSARTFGLGAGIFFAGYVLFEIPGALLAEHYSPRAWVARIMISWGLVCALMAFMRNERHFYVARFLLGAAEASLYPVLYASIIPRWFGAKDRARAIAVLLTSLQLSGIIGAPLAGWLVGTPLLGLKGWQVLFLVEAAPAIAFGFVVMRWLVDHPKDARWLTAEERAFLVQQYERESAAIRGARQMTPLGALRDREVLKLCATYFGWMTGFWGFNFWMPQALKAVSGWSNAAIGWLTAVPLFAALVVMLLVGHSSSRTGEKRWHGAICMFVGALGLALGATTTSPTMGVLLVVVSACGCYGGFGVWWSYPTTFLSGPAAAAAIAMINSIGNVGGFVGPYVTGFIKETTGSFAGAWAYLAGSMAIAGLLILTLGRRTSLGSAARSD